MTDAQKRMYVSDLYPGVKWKKKVEKMPMDQVVAIFLKHQDDGQLPEHHEMEEIPEFPEPKVTHLDIPGNGRGPHANEDQFEIY